MWCIIVSEYERYYETAFNIFARSLERLGISLLVLREQDLDTPLALYGRGILLIPDTLNQNPLLRDWLVDKYREGNLQTFFPPVAYLGSKGFLPYLREYQGMDEFIPRTILVGRKKEFPAGMELGGTLVLKASVSSGLKHVLFSDLDKNIFEAALEKARALKNPSWILQEQVPQESVPIVVFDDRGNREVKEYYLRVTAYVAANGIVDVEVTGRTDRKVHGAPDCIQLPVILSS